MRLPDASLQETLSHLYDPTYVFPVEVVAALGLAPETARQAIRDGIIRAIEALKPDETVPASARSWRVYEVLRSRYIQRLTQQEAAEHLAITDRHLRREQAFAITVLGSNLAAGAPPTEFEDWQAQVDEELLALQKGGATLVDNLQPALQSALDLVRPLAARHGITFRLEKDGPVALNVRLSEFKQAMIQLLSELAHNARACELTVSSREEGDAGKITFSGDEKMLLTDPAQNTLLNQLLARMKGSVRVEQSLNTITLTLPLLKRIKVIAVDDNPDLIHFYQRYTMGTRYELIPVPRPAQALEVIRATQPDIIVLDAMLPDIDGWELLAHLHAHPDTAHIPIVFCTVMREEELALVLGADVYLPKPVRRQQFLDALDNASRRFNQDNRESLDSPQQTADG
jgi:CheY-like chemotaxis protein